MGLEVLGLALPACRGPFPGEAGLRLLGPSVVLREKFWFGPGVEFLFDFRGKRPQRK